MPNFEVVLRNCCCHAVAALDLTDRLQSISLPTLVVVGEQDFGTPVEAARVICDGIPGAELATTPSAAHLSNVEQPEEYTRLLLGFLGRFVE